MMAASHETKARGLAVLNSPLLNKGTAFTMEERKALGLTGLLPPDISTLEESGETRLRPVRAPARCAE